MRATVRAVLPVLLVLSLFSSTAITPRSSLAPAVEAAHTSHSDSDPTEPWLSSYLLAAGAPSLNDAEAVVYCGVLGSLAAVPGVLSTAPGRLSGGEHERRFGVYQMTVAHRQLSLSSGWNLVSIPVSPLSTVISQTLYPVEGKCDLAYAYFASDADDPWKKYNTAAPSFLNDLTEIGPGWGYWIRVSEDCVARVE